MHYEEIFQERIATIQESIAAAAEAHKDAPAILAPGREALAYGHLGPVIRDTAGYLAASGIARSDRVALVLPAGPEAALAFIAVASYVACAPLNPAYTATELEFYLSDLGARAVIVLADGFAPHDGPYSAAKAREAAASKPITVIELTPRLDGPAGMFDLSAASPVSGSTGAISPAEISISDASPGDIALFLHTSGTTSRPKLVPLTHGNLVASARNVARTLMLERGDRSLCVMPLFHIHGLVAGLMASLVSGSAVFCPPLYSPDRFFSWYHEARPTWYSAVPTIHMSILAEGKKSENRRLIEAHPLRFIRSSSASLPPSVMEELETLFNAPVIEAYGMTEAAHQMTSNKLPPGERRPGSVGLAAGPEIAVMDSSGNLLPPGVTGEVVIRGSNVITGYENNPGANRDSFVNGWFRTGDLGAMDDSGFLTLTGRIKEIISRGGEKVSPREIDEALLLIPGVKEAVAFAVPHSTLGEDIAAAVVQADGAQLDEAEIRQALAPHLAAFKVPGRIIFPDGIPKGPTGKVQRVHLAEQLQEYLITTYAAPRSPIEKSVQEMWTELVPAAGPIGIYDDFFGAGGESLRLTQLLVRLRTAYDVDIPVSRIFLSPTIAGIAAFIVARQAEKSGVDILKLLDEVEASSQSI